MCDNKVNGLEDAVVSEMIKRLPLENLHFREVFSRTLHWPEGKSKFVEDREIGLLEKTCRCSRKRD